jgi:hypothetical protein
VWPDALPVTAVLRRRTWAMLALRSAARLGWGRALGRSAWVAIASGCPKARRRSEVPYCAGPAELTSAQSGRRPDGAVDDKVCHRLVA